MAMVRILNGDIAAVAGMMLRLLGFSLFALFITVIPTTSFASACDSFTLHSTLRFEPSELRRCIEEMEFNQEMQEKQIQALNVEICILATELGDTKPAAARLAERSCSNSKPAKPKRVSPLTVAPK